MFHGAINIIFPYLSFDSFILIVNSCCVTDTEAEYRGPRWRQEESERDLNTDAAAQQGNTMNQMQHKLNDLEIVKI